jgi:PAS domain S-box-containing protein
VPERARTDRAAPAPTGSLRRDRARLGGLVLLGLLVLSSIALILSATNFDRRLNEVRDADTDNQGWIVSQLEVDHQALVIAASDAILSATTGEGVVAAAEWDRLQRDFDVFYSRIAVFSAAMSRADVPPDFAADLAALMTARADLTARIDALAPEDVAGLRAFDAGLRDQLALVRRLVTQGLQVFVDEAQDARERERRIWLFFLIETLALLSLVLIAAFFAYRLSRALQQRTLQAERASATITKAYEASLSAVVVTDFDGRILLCNKAAEHMFRLPMEEITGSDARFLAPPRLRAALDASYAQMRACHAINKPCRVSRRTLAQRADGQVFPVELALTIDTDAEGHPIAIAFVRDISVQVEAEDALRGARDEARSAAAAKSMFLATMSHEMRTPLHGLIAALDLIDPGALKGEDAALFETARDCSQRALALVNDVLQFTRASAMREAVVAFTPTRIAREIVGELSPFARENGNLITLQVTGPGADDLVSGYPAAFSRSLYNLVGNAVKFTDGGEIGVDLSFSQQEADGPLSLCVAVSDQGPGIAEADRDRIFELFETSTEQGGRGAVATGLTGTGLGLPITRMAVELMGGRISLDSTPGKGSRFWFEITLPRAAETPETAHDPATPAAPMPTGLVWDVLIVDDNEVNLTVMRQMIQRLGHRATLARNGREAVELARGTRFDLILMDINMPVMDGRSAALAIRRDALSKGSLIVGVSALIEAEEPDGLRACGMDRALVKPVRFEVLATTLAELARARSQAGMDAAHAPDGMQAASRDAGPALVAAAAVEVGFDFDALAGLVGHDTAINLLQATLSDARQALDSAQAGSGTTGEMAHKALGAAAMVGLEDLAATLREIEYAAIAGDRDAILELAEVLEDVLVTTGQQVNALAPAQHAEA